MKPRLSGVALAVLALLTLTGSAVFGQTPTQRTVRVDCTTGQSIQRALEVKADELVVEISGVCAEDLLIHRDNVTLRGADPAVDGVRGVAAGVTSADGVVEVRRARNVRIENLTISEGGKSGLTVNQALNVSVANCRLVNNGRHGLAVHSSLEVDVRDTEMGGNMGRGISVFDGYNVNCLRCTIEANGNFSVLGVMNSVIGVFESSVSGRAILSALSSSVQVIDSDFTPPSPTDLALLASDYSEISLQRSRFSGWAAALETATLRFEDSEHEDNAAGFNFVDLSSILSLEGASSLTGDLIVEDFSKALVKDGSTLAGNLTCSSAGDAFCEDSGLISGSISGCASCLPPPLCVATAGAEYVISGGTEPDAGIFVDDILRVFVNGDLVAEVSQGGRCCPPANPIRFVADTGDTLRVQAQDANVCYSLEALWLQKADGSCLTQLTGDIFGPNCGSEPPEQIFFDETFPLP